MGQLRLCYNALAADAANAAVLLANNAASDSLVYCFTLLTPAAGSMDVVIAVTSRALMLMLIVAPCADILPAPQPDLPCAAKILRARRGWRTTAPGHAAGVCGHTP